MAANDARAPSGVSGVGVSGRGVAQAIERAPSSGLFDPGLALLPYLEFSRALLRAHHNAMAMTEANRLLGDAMRGILRRQQDLAFELAQHALMDGKPGETVEEGSRDLVFTRAADAVKEIGQAVIDAQLSALQTLQAKAFEAARSDLNGRRDQTPNA